MREARRGTRWRVDMASSVTMHTRRPVLAAAPREPALALRQQRVDLPLDAAGGVLGRELLVQQVVAVLADDGVHLVPGLDQRLLLGLLGRVQPALLVDAQRLAL